MALQYDIDSGESDYRPRAITATVESNPNRLKIICRPRGVVHNCFRTATIAGAFVVVSVVVTAGVAAADPVNVADVTRTVKTFDGYELSASLTEVTINSVPNMAATAFSREALLSGVGWGTFYGSNEPVIGGKLELWLMVGCQIDLKDGGYISTGPAASITDFLGALDDLVPSIGGIGPTLSLSLKPGTIGYQKLKEKQITENIAEQINTSGQRFLRIAVADAHIKMDSCGGPVSVRLGATMQLSTKNSDDESNVYGDILNI